MATNSRRSFVKQTAHLMGAMSLPALLSAQNKPTLQPKKVNLVVGVLWQH